MSASRAQTALQITTATADTAVTARVKIHHATAAQQTATARKVNIAAMERANNRRVRASKPAIVSPEIVVLTANARRVTTATTTLIVMADTVATVLVKKIHAKAGFAKKTLAGFANRAAAKA